MKRQFIICGSVLLSNLGEDLSMHKAAFVDVLHILIRHRTSLLLQGHQYQVHKRAGATLAFFLMLLGPPRWPSG